jgi:hypothetical protein
MATATASQYFTFRVTPDLLEAARQRAQAEDRSVSAVIREAMRSYTRDNGEEAHTHE